MHWFPKEKGTLQNVYFIICTVFCTYTVLGFQYHLHGNMPVTGVENA